MMVNTRTPRVVYLAFAPVPYDTPILNELARLVDLHVIYMARGHELYFFDDDWGVEPTHRYSFHWSRSIRVPGADVWVQFSLGVSRKLDRLSPDVIITKSWSPFIFEPLAWKRLRRRRFVMWSESTRVSGLTRGPLSQAVRRLILRQVDAFVSIGSQATHYLADLGIDPATVITSCLPAGLADRAIMRESWDRRGPNRPAFLFVGRLIPRKRPCELIDAFGALLRKIPEATLTIVGDGPLRHTIGDAVSAYGDRIVMRGWVEGDALRHVYQQSDILVVPSMREVWGLVVNEALAHGLYIVASDQVGSAFDLVDEASGAVIPAGDQAALLAAMEHAAEAVPHDRKARSRRAARVSSCSVTAFASDLAKATRVAVARYDT